MVVWTGYLDPEFQFNHYANHYEKDGLYFIHRFVNAHYRFRCTDDDDSVVVPHPGSSFSVPRPAVDLVGLSPLAGRGS